MSIHGMRIVLPACAASLLAGAALAQGSFTPEVISEADMRNIASGCSFVLYDSHRRMVAISTTPLERRVTFWFKAGGKLVEVSGTAVKTKEPGYIRSWRGRLQGKDILISKLSVAGNRNKPGEDSLFHGRARMNVGGAANARFDYSWEAGC